MELKRVLAKDSRTAMETINENYGENTVIVESNKVQGKVEMIVAVDINTEKEAVSKTCLKDKSNEMAIEGANDFETALNQTIRESSSKQHDGNGLTVHSIDSEKINGLLEREQLRAREIVDLIKKELAGIKEELRIERELELWNSTPTLEKEFKIFNKIFDEGSIPSGLQSILVKTINESNSTKEAFNSIKEFVMSCIPNHTPLEFNGIHAVAGNPGSGKTTIIKELCKEALKKIRSDEIAIISFDDPRLGIWSQFQLIGAKLGIDSFKASSLDTLKLILEDISDKKFILIDLPGIKTIENIKKLVELNMMIKFHLAIPSDSSADATDSLLNFRAAKWSSIVLTRLNSDGTPWQLLESFNKNKLLCSYLCGDESSATKITSYTKDRFLETKFKKLIEVFESPPVNKQNMNKTNDFSIINNMENSKLVKNNHILAPEEIMTDPILAISKLVEKKHNLAKTL